MSLPWAPGQPSQPLPIQVIKSDISVILRYCYKSRVWNCQPVDGGVGMNAWQGAPHVSQVPDSNRPIVWTGNDLIFTGKNCWRHCVLFKDKKCASHSLVLLQKLSLVRPIHIWRHTNLDIFKPPLCSERCTSNQYILSSFWTPSSVRNSIERHF